MFFVDKYIDFVDKTSVVQLRSLDKVRMEFGIVAMAHNLLKNEKVPTKNNLFFVGTFILGTF